MQQEKVLQQQQTEKRLKDTNKIVTAYGDFFNHISLRKGWKTAPFTREGVKPLFRIAALVVVKIRQDLDHATPGFKMRMVDGSAREYMWSVTTDPTKSDSTSNEFIQGIVHATFKDNTGYVEGLSAQVVQAEINSVIAAGALLNDPDPDAMLDG